jgi:hypothetical protein
METFTPYSHQTSDKESVVMSENVRSLSTIAREIQRDWKNVYFGAVPYLQALATMDKVTDDYGCDSGKSIVLYFLSNATSWRGETARRIKAELKSLVKGH